MMRTKMHLLKVLVVGNREEANPLVSKGMASGEEGNVAIVTLTTSSEENEEEELTVLS